MKQVSDFADRLLEYKETEKMTFSELSEKAKTPAPSLNRYILKKRFPKMDTVKEIAHNLNVNPMWLMGYDVDKDGRLKETQKNNDILADIVIDMRTDDEFFVVVEKLYQLKRSKPEKLAAVTAVIDALIGS